MNIFWLVTGMILVIISISLSYYNSGLKKKNSTKKILKPISVTLLCIGLLLVVFSYYKYIVNIYSAKKMLSLSKNDTQKYNSLCRSLFENTGDKEMLSQYLDMKEKRPQSEVNNLCGNYAKIILSRK